MEVITARSFPQKFVKKTENILFFKLKRVSHLLNYFIKTWHYFILTQAV